MESTTLTLLIALLLLPDLTTCQEPDIVFTQPEEQDSGTFVGSVESSPNILAMVGQDDRAILQYSILTEGYENSNYFLVDRNSGNITFNGKVDREEICPFTDVCEISFGVAVRGGNNFFSKVLVKVVITDKNDNSPEFLQSTVTVHISESANPSDFVLPLTTAIDADRSLTYGVNTYRIVPESSIFGVDFGRNEIGTPRLSLLLKKRLDRETLARYTINVVAADGGDLPKTGTLVVTVEVDDFNDNGPVFLQTFYTANFSENSGPGYEIIQVSATDKDAGPNSDISYSLSLTPNVNINIRDKIAVNSSRGFITLVHSLTSGEYNVLIDAQDNGTPRKSSQAVVKVTVLDTENNTPVVTVNAVQLGDLPLGYVSESADPSTVVAVLDVLDPDSGRNGNVTCQSSNSYFQLRQLQKYSYKLMVASPLDRERNQTHLVSVTCRDQGTPSLNQTTTIRIHVADVNDKSPVFSRVSYDQKIVENNMIGDTVTIVHALDEDEGENARIEYRLENGGGNFSIIPTTGLIKANRRFDREQRSRYDFTVLAIDYGSPRRSSTASVVITIIDVNDVEPIFSKSLYDFYFYENRNADSVVGNVSASDTDLEQDGVISFSLSPMTTDGAEEVPFTIDSHGRISSTEKFDREDKNSYTFYVVATDNGHRPLSSSAAVTVHILDLNDNRPKFVSPSEHNFSVIVNIPIKNDDVILTTDVDDDDENKNSIITYAITSSNGSGLFRIGKFSGEIIANRDLGGPEMGTYSITINATDQGHPVMWQSLTLRLIVQSESARRDDVTADQNVLIVVCIVCFTIIISGVVLVAMCVLRRLDRQKNLQYAAAGYPNIRSGSETGSISDQHQQYDLSAPASKEPSLQPEKDSPYHQQPLPLQPQQQQHHQGNRRSEVDHRDTTSSFSKGTNSHGFQDQSDRKGIRSGYQKGPAFHLMGPGAKVPETSAIHRHDDFFSTSSTETVTGDSGHGSDEDLSNSMDRSIIPSNFMEHTLKSNDGLSASHCKGQCQGHGESDASTVAATNQMLLLHTVQKPSTASASKNSTARGKMNSVRFDPRVTDIYDAKPVAILAPPSRQYSNNENIHTSTNNINAASAPAAGVATTSSCSSKTMSPRSPSYSTSPVGGLRQNPQQQHQQQQQQQQQQQKQQRLSDQQRWLREPGRLSQRDRVHPRLVELQLQQHQQQHHLYQNEQQKHQQHHHPHQTNHLLSSNLSHQHSHRHQQPLYQEQQQQQQHLPLSSSLSLASSLNDDDSDFNTTTSGSYSIASTDDVAHISGLMSVKDLYV